MRRCGNYLSGSTQDGATAVTTANNFNNEIQFSMLPLGFLKMALEHNATVSKEKKDTVLSFPMENGTAYKTTVKGYINDQGLVERVETMIDSGMLGDTKWEATFSNYKDFGGVKFPTSIVQRQGGPKILEMTVADVKVNQPVDLTPPAGRGGRGGFGGPGAAKGAGKGKGGPGAAKGGPGGFGGGGRGAPAEVESEDLGGGFWLVTGGYGAVIADFNDYVIVIEGPSGDARADQIISEAKRLVPNKPIKYVINTHAHFDHSQGLRDFVAQGATIITNQGNKGYYEKVLANPHTLVPDNLQKMNPKPKIKVEYVGDTKKITDGTHEIDLYQGDEQHAQQRHADGVPAQAEDPDRGRRVQRPQSDPDGAGAESQPVSGQPAGQHRTPEPGCRPDHPHPSSESADPQGAAGGIEVRGGQIVSKRLLLPT